MGDASEALVVSELTLAGVPAAKMPDNWPNYDVIAEPEGANHPQRVSVKTRTFRRSGDSYVEYHINDKFDWLAIVVLPNAVEGETERRVFLFPKAISDTRFHQSRDGAKYHDFRSLRVDKMKDVLREFENNFGMSGIGVSSSN